MNGFRNALLIIVAVFALLQSAPLAGQYREATSSPRAEARVAELLSRFQVSGDPLVLFEYVDWEGAYQALRGSERIRMGVRSPAEFERYLRQVLAREAATTTDRSAVLRATTYRVLGSVVRQGRAEVQFQSEFRGSSRSQTIELIERQGEWFLPSPELRLAAE
jgi:hypothetical protein